MPIYTASYFEPDNHHGSLISISITKPKRFEVSEKLNFFCPSAQLLKDYKAGLPWDGKRDPFHPEIEPPAEHYVNRYRDELKASITEWRNWLRDFDPNRTVTLLCWEKAGQNCHRNLVYQAIAKFDQDLKEIYKSDRNLLGGMDLPYVNGETVEAWDSLTFRQATWRRQLANGRHVVQRGETTCIPHPVWVRKKPPS